MTTAYRLSVTLASGECLSFECARMPRHWKSWVMQKAPYGTSFTGCSFSREAVA